MRFLFSILLVFQVNTFSFKNSTYPDFIGFNLKQIEQNSDYKILKKAEGDLNNDGLSDMSLVLESNLPILEKRCVECHIKKSKARIILVLLNSYKGYEVVIQNNKFIARDNEGGRMLPHFQPDLFIKDNLLTIYYQYTRGNQSYVFKFQNNQLLISEAKSIHVHSASGDYENTEFNFKLKKLKIETGNISAEDSKTQVYEFEANPKSLSEFDKTYSWEILEYRYL